MQINCFFHDQSSSTFTGIFQLAFELFRLIASLRLLFATQINARHALRRLYASTFPLGPTVQLLCNYTIRNTVNTPSYVKRNENRFVFSALSFNFPAYGSPAILLVNFETSKDDELSLKQLYVTNGRNNRGARTRNNEIRIENWRARRR